MEKLKKLENLKKLDREQLESLKKRYNDESPEEKKKRRKLISGVLATWNVYVMEKCRLHVDGVRLPFKAETQRIPRLSLLRAPNSEKPSMKEDMYGCRICSCAGESQTNFM